MSTSQEQAVYGGIEAGGTKFVCATGTSPDDIRSTERIETTTPAETLARVIGFFRDEMNKTPLAGVGIGSFGPLDLNPDSATYGFITSTPKPGWARSDLAGAIGRALDVPVAIDTDVNAAALAEGTWGAAQGLDTFIYLTVGTGIGGGAVMNGKLLHGINHPEMGHIFIPHDRVKDPFMGACPYHGDCLEGLASGEAIRQRWGKPAGDLPPEHPAWELEADYLAAGLATYICTLAPQRIIVGGGVAQQPHLLPMVRERVQSRLNGYINLRAITEDIQSYIVPPALGNRAGVLGAIRLVVVGI